MVKDYFEDDWATLNPQDLDKRRNELSLIIEAVNGDKEKSLKAVSYFLRSLCELRVALSYLLVQFTDTFLQLPSDCNQQYVD